MWSLLDHLDKLNILSELSNELVCECPSCNGHRLTISKSTGAYSCWTTECPPSDIRTALGESSGITPYNKRIARYRPAVITEDIELARLPLPVSADLSEETWYDYGKSCRVHRYKDKVTGDKLTIPYCRDIRGKGRQLWLPYRFDELRLASGKWVLGVEGEKCVEYARSIGLVATTWQGSSWTPVSLMSTVTMLKSAGVRGMVFWADMDVPGFRKAEKLWRVCAMPMLPKDKFKLVVVDPRRIWGDIEEGQDIADWVLAGYGDVGEVERVANEMKNIKLDWEG